MSFNKWFLFISVLFYGQLAFATEVVSWVSWYGVEASKVALENQYGNVKVKDVVSKLGLQFWNINSQGEVFHLRYNEKQHTTDADVKYFVDWGKANNVDILLTVMNIGHEEFGYDSFDWRLVRNAAYGTRGDTLIQNLLNVLDSFDLDGIDLDLEGEGGAGAPFTQDDRQKYAVFVNKLSDSLKVRNKYLGVATYHANSVGGAPLPSWWEDWKDKVDMVYSMGYYHIYWNAPGEIGYPGQYDLITKAGYKPEQLGLGMPVWFNNWSGDKSNTGASNIENLNFVLNCQKGLTSLALWELSHLESNPENLEPKVWSQDSVWILLKDIRDNKAADTTKCPELKNDPKIIDDMSNKGVNLKGGVWGASSDFWQRKEAEREEKATKVYNREQDHDMVAQHGLWGEIGKGYEEYSKDNNILFATVKTHSDIKENEPAYGGFLMNFLPVDPTIDPDASPWEVNKIGVEADYSSYDSLVVGIRCEKGQSIRLTLNSKADLNDFSRGAYGKDFSCTGKFENYAMEFKELKPVWGAGEAGFDPAHTLRLTILWLDLAKKKETSFAISGIGLDTNIVATKPNLDKVELPTFLSPTTESLSFQVNGTGFEAISEGSFVLSDVTGREIEKGVTTVGLYTWKNPLEQGVYYLTQEGIATPIVIP